MRAGNRGSGPDILKFPIKTIFQTKYVTIVP